MKQSAMVAAGDPALATGGGGGALCEAMMEDDVVPQGFEFEEEEEEVETSCSESSGEDGGVADGISCNLGNHRGVVVATTQPYVEPSSSMCAAAGNGFEHGDGRAGVPSQSSSLPPGSSSSSSPSSYKLDPISEMLPPIRFGHFASSSGAGGGGGARGEWCDETYDDGAYDVSQHHKGAPPSHREEGLSQQRHRAAAPGENGASERDYFGVDEVVLPLCGGAGADDGVEKERPMQNGTCDGGDEEDEGESYLRCFTDLTRQPLQHAGKAESTTSPIPTSSPRDSSSSDERTFCDLSNATMPTSSMASRGLRQSSAAAPGDAKAASCRSSSPAASAKESSGDYASLVVTTSSSSSFVGGGGEVEPPSRDVATPSPDLFALTAGQKAVPVSLPSDASDSGVSCANSSSTSQESNNMTNGEGTTTTTTSSSSSSSSKNFGEIIKDSIVETVSA